MESRQSNSLNNFHAPKLNLDQDNSNFNSEKPELKNALNLNIEGTNSAGYYITNTLGNKLCFEYPKNYILNGKVDLNNEEFLLFFKTPTSSEIGILDSKTCTYKKWVNDPCLNFNTDYWISGYYKFNNICDNRSVYIADGFNTDKILYIDKEYPKIITGYKNDNCKTPIYSNKLNCDELLANQKIKYPCIELSSSAGNLENGKYQIAIAYSDNIYNYTDYFISSSIILFDNQNGIEVKINNLDLSHNYYKLILIAITENGQYAKEIGIYNTRQNKIIISNIFNKKDIDLQELYTLNTNYITSKHIAVINNQLVKAGLIEHQEIYYQPQANKIKANWVVKRIKPELAYLHPQYMRDEPYAFFIQWITTDGYKHKKVFIPNNVSANKNKTSGNDYYEGSIDCITDKTIYNYWTYNYARVTQNYEFDCEKENCDKIVMRGTFSGFESDELYSDYSFSYKGKDIKYWGELACKNISLHKFPDNCITNHFYKCDENCNSAEYIDILGVEFSNIEHPKDLDGNYISNIIGYRILRADRNGNEIILSKGLFNNFLYDKNENQYFQNFPYNSLQPNEYISNTQAGSALFGETGFDPMTDYSKRLFSYISPETSYTLPQVGSEISLYNEHIGNICWKFQETYKHPKHILLTNFAHFFSVSAGVVEGILKFKGEECKTTTTETVKTCLDIAGWSLAPLGTITPPPTAAIPSTPSIISVEVKTINPSFPTKYQIIVKLNCNVIGGTITLQFANFSGTNLPTLLTIPVTGDTGTLNNILSLPPDIQVGFYTSPSLTFDGTVSGLCEVCNGIETTGTNITTTDTKCTSIQSLLENQFGTIPGNSAVSSLFKLITSAYYGWQSVKNTETTIKGLSNFRQYAFQFDSISNYNMFDCGNIKESNKRRQILSMDRLIPGKIQVNDFRINNSNRISSTYILLNEDIEDPLNIDNSRFNFNGQNDTCKINGCCDRQSVSYYGAIKRKNFSPYGQLDVNTIPISCWNYIDNLQTKFYNTEPLFNGDTFISTFSVKNHYPLFLNMPIGEDPDFIIDYRNYGNIGFPRYWINTIPLNVFTFQGISTFFNFSDFTNSFGEQTNFHLDCDSTFRFEDLDPTSNFNIDDAFIKKGKFYTSVNGVFNFYVESSYCNNYRKKADILHYPLEDWETINRSDKQIFDNEYSYNQFLRFSEISESALLQDNFTPQTCNKEDYKLVYSEIDNNNDLRDNWKIFRPLSFTQLSKKDGELTTIHPIDDNNLMVSFENKTYVTQADETLLTKSGNSIYLGSGDIFSRKMNPLTLDNTGYTGSVDKYSFYNTRYGTVWVDRKRKKIFLYSVNSQFKELSSEGINQWLQFHLSDDKPTNHEESIKTIYDNHFDLIYITNNSKTNDNYEELVDDSNNIKSDCSWTLSYKHGHGWISFHSFIPVEYFTLPNDFLSSNKDGIWKHNIKKIYHTFYNIKQPYMFSFVTNANNEISQDTKLRHETITELNFNNQKYHNDIFFNKFMIFTERTNSGLRNIILRNNDQLTSQITDYSAVSCTYQATNYWTINNYRNFAIDQPHYQLNCNGYDFTVLNIKDTENPNIVGSKNGIVGGNIEGNWFQTVYINDNVHDKRFKTFFSIYLKDKIKTNK